MKPVRNMTPVVFLILMIALVASVGCDSSNNPTTPAPGGGSADIDVLASTPASGNTNISGSAVTVSTTLEDADTTRVQVNATTDGNLREILVYFKTATGVVEAVSYEWGTSSVFENIVYCPVASCANVSVNIATREITFSGTALDDHGNPAPTDPPAKFATLGQAVPASMVVYPAP